MINEALWISAPREGGCPEFYREIILKRPIRRAILSVSAAGMYAAYIDGKRVGNELFTPYWTQYEKRLQYQSYDVTDMLGGELSFVCAEGWAVGVIGYDRLNHSFSDKIALIFSLDIEYEDGEKESIISDGKTRVRTSRVISSQIYDGEEIDFTAEKTELGNAVEADIRTRLIPQEGERVIEQDRVRAVRLIVTPKGERVIDFGQNLSGYVEVRIRGARGGRVTLSHAEVLDRDGNFYTENLRGAKQRMSYVLSGNGEETLKPRFSWQGFRYIRLDEYPSDRIDLSSFTAIAVHSDIRRTGSFICGNEKINRLYRNIIWGQKSNYIDVPTDCPQRDERLGWTGDAQVFARTAAINFDVERFFRKWLRDLSAGQGENGEVYGIAPMVRLNYKTHVSAGWGDAAVICPWEMYLAYGNEEILAEQFESMRGWIEYMRGAEGGEYLWLGGKHYGDWLGMDGDGYMGATSHDYIASAFYAYSTSIFIKAGKALGRDMTEYETLYKNIVCAFRERFTENGAPTERTQTAYVLALRFGLCGDREKTARELVKVIEENGTRLTTGFVGAPYLLHALTDAGRTDIAYELLLREECPSWLFSVNRGATTMWEHWDGMNEDGDFWSRDMNSFNHYAYGSVYDWIFGAAAGITVLDDGAGYRHISLKPLPDRRLGFVEAAVETRLGKVSSSWHYEDDRIRYEFDVPPGCRAEAELPDGRRETLFAGHHIF